jgi:hypothetical protein
MLDKKGYVNSRACTRLGALARAREHTHTCAHTQICNTYYFPMARVVAWKRLDITVYAHCLSCYIDFCENGYGFTCLWLLRGVLFGKRLRFYEFVATPRRIVRKTDTVLRDCGYSEAYCSENAYGFTWLWLLRGVLFGKRVRFYVFMATSRRLVRKTGTVLRVCGYSEASCSENGYGFTWLWLLRGVLFGKRVRLYVFMATPRRHFRPQTRFCRVQQTRLTSLFQIFSEEFCSRRKRQFFRNYGKWPTFLSNKTIVQINVFRLSFYRPIYFGDSYLKPKFIIFT